MRPLYKVVRQKLKFNIHLTEHCNLNCRGCYHFSSIAKKEYLDVEEYEKDIKRLSELFNGAMEEIFLMGGEPLLHYDIHEFLHITRNNFKNGKIKILTNGTLLLNMKEIFWNACKEKNIELWVTKYPIPFDYDKAEKVAKEKGVLLRYFNKEPMRTLGHQPLEIMGSQDYRENFDGCYRANECIMLDHGKMYTCLVPATIRHFNSFFDQKLEVCNRDYVDIYSVASGDELLEKLTVPTPFCRYCDRNSVSVFGCIPWEVTRHRIEEWTE